MLNIFVWFRYLLFALSIVCSAVITSVSVWNFGYAQILPKSFGRIIQVDSYVIFVGAFALVGTFVIIFMDVYRKNTWTSRIWFECLWSFGLFLLNLSSAIVVTVLVPSQMCSDQLPEGACTSTKLLQGFTWFYTVVLFGYFFTVFVTVFIRSESGNRLWGLNIYSLGSAEPSNNSTRLHSPPSSPIPSMLNLIAAPKPQRPLVNTVPNLMPYTYRAGLSPSWQIEHFQYPLPSSRQKQIQRPPPVAGAGPSNLYPEFLHSSLPLSAQPSFGNTSPQQTQTSDFPLGQWPRPDIMSRSSRRATATSSLQHHDAQPQAAVSGPDGELGAALISRSRPFGPRTRSGSNSGGEIVAQVVHR
jgi:hypothetical protein